MKIKIYLLSLLVLQGFSLTAKSETFYTDSFETAPLKTAFSWTDSGGTSIVNHPAKQGDSGSRALQFSYAANGGQAEARFALTKAYPDVWIRYWLQVPTNFKHLHPAGTATNDKLFALWMDDYSAKGLGPSVVWEFWEDGKSGSQLAVHYSEGNYTICGAHLQEQPFISYPADQGRWMQIVLHVRASTGPGANNGLIETFRRWDNENTFTQLHKLTNVNIAPPAGGPAGWKAGYFMGWTNPGYLEETLWYVNDVEVADTSLLSLASKPNFPDATLYVK